MNILQRAVMLPMALLWFASAVAQDGPESVLRGTKEFQRSVLVSGLAGPWELTWGPDQMLWVTERTGKRITRIDPVSGRQSVAATIDEVTAPGAQDGLLGMALHPDLLRHNGHDYVYVAYTYVDRAKGPNPAFPVPASPYHFFYSKIVRLTYDPARGTLSKPLELIRGLPAGNDHVSGRLKIGPDRKLYFTIGDGGHNQITNFCLHIEAQRLPTRDEIGRKDYAAYAGKSLRLNLDGSIPQDNPQLAGVVSHVYTYGHRNMQGIDFGPDGTLYASEHGPKTDDEINILRAGSNYGWPHVAGLKDDKAYEYARWADASTPCSQLTFSDLVIDPSVPRESESSYHQPFVEPIATMFTVPTGYNFHDPACKGVDFICWPTVGPSSIEYYSARGSGRYRGRNGIPGWDKVLLVTTLKRGSLYVLPLTPDGKAAAGHFSRYFQSENRYRDLAVSPDGRTIYIATDNGGLAESLSGGATGVMQDPGAILAFRYVGEGTGAAADSGTAGTSSGAGAAGGGATATAPTSTATPPRMATGRAPQFTAQQAAAGKAAFESRCAVCHGNTLTDGTYAPPLAGEYFRNKWAGMSVRSLYDHSRTMPPAAPGSLGEETYADIVAYILELNGSAPGDTTLSPDGAALEGMTIR
jgi:PQQ-dependent dehydrogenase (s-GDH family)